VSAPVEAPGPLPALLAAAHPPARALLAGNPCPHLSRPAIPCPAPPLPSVTNAGYGWASGDATQCNPGYYNPGSNNRRCSRCPGGLTTASALSTDPTACVAPPGSYYLRGKAVLCAQGTWKNTTANEDCQECPAGITTAATESGKTAPADCACEWRPKTGARPARLAPRLFPRHSPPPAPHSRHGRRYPSPPPQS
jgi:hypothetical protein